MTVGDVVKDQKEHPRILKDHFGCAFTLTASRSFVWKIQVNYPGSRVVYKTVIAQDSVVTQHEANIHDAIKMLGDLMDLMNAPAPIVP